MDLFYNLYQYPTTIHKNDYLHLGHHPRNMFSHFLNRHVQLGQYILLDCCGHKRICRSRVGYWGQV